MTTEKHPVVLFSGGLDSSYQLYETLKKGDCYTLYVDGNQGPDKCTAEQIARKHIMELLEKTTGNKVIEDYVVGPDSFMRANMVYLPDRKFSQAYKWLFAALEVTDGKIHSELITSYVMSDQMCYWLKDYREAWMALQSFTKQNPIPITFPFVEFGFSKYEIVTGVRYHLPELLTKVWVCEDAVKKEYAPFKENVHSPLPDTFDYSHCGHCDACQTLMAAQFKCELKYKENFANYIETRTADLDKSFITDAYKLLRTEVERQHEAEEPSCEQPKELIEVTVS